MTASTPAVPPSAKPPSSVRRRILFILLFILLILVILAWLEFRSSRLEAWYFTGIDRQLHVKVESGASNSIRFPTNGGPYDQRLGYAQLPDYIQRLQTRGFVVGAQARQSASMTALADQGLFIPYHEKDQAGLTLQGYHNALMYAPRSPVRTYSSFKALPKPLVDTLLYVENHTLLDNDQPLRNPAVEWARFGKALGDQAVHVFGPVRHSAGASTLATQIEKYRHSPDGRTGSAREKLRQMESASLRAYLGGERTLAARQQLVLEYINTVPLAARPGFGEISGVGDGLWAWYGRDFDRVNRVLRDDKGAPVAERALLYKEALSLFVAQRSPSFFLNGDMKVLEGLVNSYLRLMARDGVISQQLCDDALRVSLRQQRELVRQPPPSPVESKAVNAVRNKVASLLGMPRLYDLDRLDLSVNTTIDTQMQQEVTEQLLKLRDPDYAKSVGLSDEHLLQHGAPQGVTYSFTLLESTPSGNRVRVQADNFDQPFDINEGTKLDLGSTAKLRTLVTYLEIINDLHTQYAGMDKAALQKIPVLPQESILKRWAIDYLIQTPDHGLTPMLQAAMERKYSASPGESFFTGGGLHTFANFDKSDNSRIMTLREATQHSVNLVYVRLMRDIVHYYMDQAAGNNAGILENEDDPRRMVYLQRFADREGQTFLVEFYRKYQGKSSDDQLDTLLDNIHITPKRLAVILRAIDPQATLAQYTELVADYDPAAAEKADMLSRLFDQYAPGKFDLQDQGYLAGVHPLELWLLGYLRQHPNAHLSDVIKASSQQRIEVYKWLLRSHHRKYAQDKRIKQLLEVEAFLEVHKDWKRLGYPFDSMVPSYASALGASADRPAALAELMGDIVNNGIHVPTIYVDQLHFASGTPYDTAMVNAPTQGERVLPVEITTLVKQVLSEVVDKGTARRVAGAFDAPNGAHVLVGGKTGTGDNRYKTFARGGGLISARVVSRSGAFVFYLDDHYFGTLVAYVAGPQAQDYQFTSALPVQILKVLAPALKKHLHLVDTGLTIDGKKPGPIKPEPVPTAASGAASGIAHSGAPRSTAGSGRPARTATSGKHGKPATMASSGKATAGAHSGKPANSAASGKHGKPARTAASGQALDSAGSSPHPQVKKTKPKAPAVTAHVNDEG